VRLRLSGAGLGSGRSLLLSEERPSGPGGGDRAVVRQDIESGHGVRPAMCRVVRRRVRQAVHRAAGSGMRCVEWRGSGGRCAGLRASGFRRCLGCPWRESGGRCSGGQARGA
jgi:hypothetical protein